MRFKSHSQSFSSVLDPFINTFLSITLFSPFYKVSNHSLSGGVEKIEKLSLGAIQKSFTILLLVLNSFTKTFLSIIMLIPLFFIASDCNFKPSFV